MISRGAAIAAAMALAAPVAAFGSLDQGPIVRVLRPNDVPDATNQWLPSGALDLGEFAPLAVQGATGRAGFRHDLSRHQFRSAGITAFDGPGQRQWRSFAVELGSPKAAAGTVGGAAQALTVGGPAGTIAKVSRDVSVYHGLLISFSGAPGRLGGYAVVTSTGRYLYSLMCLDRAGRVERSDVEALLRRIIQRANHV